MKTVALPVPGWLIFDFDGVFTDNRVWVSDTGAEMVACNRSDGLGIRWLREAGVRMFVLTAETNPVVARRCEKLALEHYIDPSDKRSALLALAEKKHIDFRETAYVGNDINDLGAMSLCGTTIAPADADPAVKKAADIVLETKGGEGVAKEVFRRFFPEEWNKKCLFPSKIKPS